MECSVLTGHTYKKFVVGRERLGAGAFGQVSKAQSFFRNSKHMDVALKISSEHDMLSVPIREVAILSKLRHTNIIRMYDAGSMSVGGDVRLYIAMELMPADLGKVKHCDFSLCELSAVATQLFRGLSFMHQFSIAHRDIKPDNILIDTSMRLCIGDLGLARDMSEKVLARPLTRVTTTLWYRAPEIALGDGTYDFGVDVWSATLVLLELATKAPVFVANSEVELIMNIFRLLGTPTLETWLNLPSYAHYSPEYPRWVPKRLEVAFPTAGSAVLDFFSFGARCNPHARPSADLVEAHDFCRLAPRVPFLESSSLIRI